MKKLLLSLFLCSTLGVSAQVTVFEDSFETYEDFAISGFGDWITLDLDGLGTYAGGSDLDWPNRFQPQAFQIFNPTAAGTTNATLGVNESEENRNFDPHTGLKFAGCWAGSPTATVTRNNDWLVSPPISLVGATGSSLSVWVKSMSDTYGLEKYKVAVYTGTGTPSVATDFTVISGVADLTAPYTWTERIQSLSAYDGTTIRLAIQCRTPDAYMFMVDDFKVTAATMSVKDVLSSKFVVSPNPASDVIKISSKESILLNGIKITDLNGRTVKQLTYDGISNPEINVGDLSAGMYMMTINSDQGIAIKKIVKK